MQTRFIRARQLFSTKNSPGRWPIAPATGWRWVATGRLPAPVKLSEGVTAWPLEVIEAQEAQWASAK